MAADTGSGPKEKDGTGFSYDVFLSHASEDKAAFVDDLFRALGERGLRVWYDKFEIGLGDDFRRMMESGLRGSRYGAVVLSPSFLQASKFWTQEEVSALLNQEAVGGEKRILPILYGVDWPTLTNAFPILATRRAANASDGVDVVANQIHAAVTKKPLTVERSASPLYGVPLPSQSFVGRRKELDALRAVLAQVGDVQVCASIEGLPGIGKTELVLKAAHDLAAAGEFPGGIFWLPAETPDLTTTWASDAIAARLGIVGETVRDRATNVVTALGRRNARVLVILDNVERWDAGAEPGPLPTGPRVTLLVTTRRRRLGGPRFKPFSLEVLTESDARALLAGLAGTAAERPGFEDLLHELDGHALAVELAGVYLREYPEVTPQQYLVQLRSGRDPAVKVADDVRYARSADQALDLLWQRLDAPTRRWWQIASWFAPEPATAALADKCGVDGDARRALHRFHLVDLDPDGRFRMHRLTHAFGRRAGTEDERAQARRSFLKGVTDYGVGIDIMAGFRIYAPDRAQFDEAVRFASEDNSGVDAAPLLDRVGTALQSMGDLPRARDLFEKALALDLKNHGESNPAVAIRRANFALVVQALGDLPRARDLLEQALASLGDSGPAVASVRANLAVVVRALGDLPRARDLLEQSLAFCLEHLGENHESVATFRSSLALVVKDLGDLPRARDLLEQALASDLKNLGERHPFVATDRSNLAVVIKDLGDLPRARDLLEQALASDLKNLPKDHPSIAVRRYNLADILLEEGDLAGARTLLADVIRAETATLGPQHPSLALTRAKMAQVVFAAGDAETARAEAREAVLIVSAQPSGSFLRQNVEILTAAILRGLPPERPD